MQNSICHKEVCQVSLAFWKIIVNWLLTFLVWHNADIAQKLLTVLEVIHQWMYPLRKNEHSLTVPGGSWLSLVEISWTAPEMSLWLLADCCSSFFSFVWKYSLTTSPALLKSDEMWDILEMEKYPNPMHTMGDCSSMMETKVITRSFLPTPLGNTLLFFVICQVVTDWSVGLHKWDFSNPFPSNCHQSPE